MSKCVQAPVGSLSSTGKMAGGRKKGWWEGYFAQGVISIGAVWLLRSTQTQHKGGNRCACNGSQIQRMRSNSDRHSCCRRALFSAGQVMILRGQEDISSLSWQTTLLVLLFLLRTSDSRWCTARTFVRLAAFQESGKQHREGLTRCPEGVPLRSSVEISRHPCDVGFVRILVTAHEGKQK